MASARWCSPTRRGPLTSSRNASPAALLRRASVVDFCHRLAGGRRPPHQKAGRAANPIGTVIVEEGLICAAKGKAASGPKGRPPLVDLSGGRQRFFRFEPSKNRHARAPKGAR